MNEQDLRTLLQDRAEAVDGSRPDRLDELFGRIRTRRRPRATAVAAATMAVALGVFGAATLNRGDDRSAPPPVSGPTKTDLPTPHGPQARPIVYLQSRGRVAEYFAGDGTGRGNGWKGMAFHYGDRLVRTGVRYSWTDPTDDGVAFSGEDGRVYFYFADTASIEQIGSLGFEPGSYRASGLVRSGSSGSLLAWFDLSDPTSPELMVYDTGRRRPVARHPVPPCKELCTTEAVIGEHVYWSDLGLAYGEADVRNIRIFDLATGSDSAADSSSYADDVRHRPRGLILGSSPDGEVVVPGEGLKFEVQGPRLVVAAQGDQPPYFGSPEVTFTSAIDTATSKPIDLSLPKGYRTGAQFDLMQWVDDDRFAVIGHVRKPGEVNDILVCGIAASQCRLAIPQGEGERVAPQLPLAF